MAPERQSWFIDNRPSFAVRSAAFTAAGGGVALRMRSG